MQHVACFLCNFSSFASCSSQLIARGIHLEAWNSSHLALQVVICVCKYRQLLFLLALLIFSFVSYPATFLLQIGLLGCHATLPFDCRSIARHQIAIWEVCAIYLRNGLVRMLWGISVDAWLMLACLHLQPIAAAVLTTFATVVKCIV